MKTYANKGVMLGDNSVSKSEIKYLLSLGIILGICIGLLITILNPLCNDCQDNCVYFEGRGVISIFNESLNQTEIVQIYISSYNLNNKRR
jgi:hypothetical protein